MQTRISVPESRSNIYMETYPLTGNDWGSLGALLDGTGDLLQQGQLYKITDVGLNSFTADPYKAEQNLSGYGFSLLPTAGPSVGFAPGEVQEKATDVQDIKSWILEWRYVDNNGVIHLLDDVDLLAKDAGQFDFEFYLLPADAGLAESVFPYGTYYFQHTLVTGFRNPTWPTGTTFAEYDYSLVSAEEIEYIFDPNPVPRYQTKLMEFQAGIQDNIVEVSYDALRLRQAIDRKADTKEKNVMCLVILQRAMRDMHILAFDEDYKCPTEEDVDRYISLASRESRTGNID